MLLIGLCPASFGQTVAPPAEGIKPATDSAKPPSGQASDAAKKLAEELVNSPDSVTVANYQCAAVDKECPLSSTVKLNGADQKVGEVISTNFNATLADGKGQDTLLVTALKAILQGEYRGENVWAKGADNALIYLVRHGVDEKDPVTSRWLLAERGVGGIKITATKRIMGKSRIAFVFVHVNAALNTGQDARETYGDVELRAIAKPKLPANVARLINLLRFAAGLQAAAPGRTSLLGYGVFDKVPVPSDLTAFEVRTQPKVIVVGKPETYDNEGRYLWDVSVGVPVNKLTLLDYSDEGNTFVPKTINKQSVYGLINLYPYPVDIKEGKWRYILPRAVAGVGLTGRPGENFFVGGAAGFSWLQFFVGSGFANRRTLIPGRNPMDGTSYEQRYASRLTYGLNIPVSAALKKVTSAVASAGGKQETAKK